MILKSEIKTTIITGLNIKFIHILSLLTDD